LDLNIALDDVELFGSGLARPEGVMATREGVAWCADARGACTRIAPDGSSERFGNLGGTPNGICIDRDGAIIVANIGSGEVQRLFPDGRHELVANTMDGKPTPTPNFPFIDKQGRMWVTNSSAHELEDATRTAIPDGSVYVVEGGESRELAGDIQFANGITLDEKEEFAYVAETMGRRVLQYAIRDDGSLGPPEQYGPILGDHAHPDGIAFDAAGNLWVTLVSINALGVITPDGELVIALDDPRGTKLRRPTNICFGGENLQTAYVGSLAGSFLATFQAPFPGMPLIHQI
jgi:sugar lactone lactonase YvrE